MPNQFRDVNSSARSTSSVDDGTREPEEPLASGIQRSHSIWSGIVLALLVTEVSIAIYAPLVRCFWRVDFNYNEGWNVYSALLAVKHNLYPAKYAWTTVNYPFLSFFVIGHLSSIFGDPLFVGRAFSLAGLLLSCLAAYCIVRRLGGSRAPAFYAAIYFLWTILVIADGYIGMDDPTLLALAVILFALYVYVRYRDAWWSLPAVAFIFILGGNIKHNLIAAPLAVFVDLLFAARGRVLRYASWGALFVFGSVFVNRWAGGPYFVAQILAPRQFTLSKLVSWPTEVFAIAVPLCISAIWSVWKFRDSEKRVIGLYLLISFVIGVGFFGGGGTAQNMFFDSFMAVSIIMGLILDSLWHSKIPGIQISNRFHWVVPLLLWQVACANYPPVHRQELLAKKAQFGSNVAFIKAQPGPAICESLLQCYFAGKPYVYDPFNSTQLVQFGYLDPKPMIRRIENHEFGAIEMNEPVEATSRPSPRFPDPILDAIDKSYRIAVRGSDGVIYVPKPAPGKD